MTKQPSNIPFSIYFFVFLFSLLLIHFTSPTIFASAGKRRVHIPDELDDVVDDEEDDDWKDWGKKKSEPSPKIDSPPPDFNKMDMTQIQAEMIKQQAGHSGPVFGFVKLRLGVKRTPDIVSEIAMKWTKVSKTGGIEVSFMVVDLSTIMFTMHRGQDKEELKDFILDQEDAYEVKIGEQVFRRPGDPPVEEVIEKLRQEREETETDHASPIEDHEYKREEL